MDRGNWRKGNEEEDGGKGREEGRGDWIKEDLGKIQGRLRKGTDEGRRDVTVCASGTLMDALYETWNQDAVHGERIAYTKIGLALLKLIDRKNHSNMRSRENRSPSGGGFDGGEGRRVDYRQDGPSASTSSTSRTGRERSRSSHSTIPGSYDRRRGSPPGRRGGYRRDY